MKNNGNTPEVDTDQDISLQTDKELLEDFLNSLDQIDVDAKAKITDIQSVTPEIRMDKFLWVIKLKETELERCQAIAAESKAKTENWLETKKQSIQSTIDYLTGQMKNYLISQDLKSLSLPMGMIGFRKQPDIIEITDEELFITEADPGLLRHVPEKFEADLKSVKEHIKTTGEIPAGVEVRSKDPKFYYKLNET